MNFNWSGTVNLQIVINNRISNFDCRTEKFDSSLKIKTEIILPKIAANKPTNYYLCIRYTTLQYVTRVHFCRLMLYIPLYAKLH